MAIVSVGDLRELSAGLIPTRYTDRPLAHEPEARWGDILIGRSGTGELRVARYSDIQRDVFKLVRDDEFVYVDDSLAVIKPPYDSTIDLIFAYLSHPSVQARINRMAQPRRVPGRVLAESLSTLPIPSFGDRLDLRFLVERLGRPGTLCEVLADFHAAREPIGESVLRYAKLGDTLESAGVTDVAGKLSSEAIDSVSSRISSLLAEHESVTEDTFYAGVEKVVCSWWSVIQEELEDLSACIRDFKGVTLMLVLHETSERLGELTPFGGATRRGRYRFGGDTEHYDFAESVPPEVETVASTFLDHLQGAVRDEVERLRALDLTRVSVAPEMVAVGIESVVTIMLHNEGPLPLRQVRVHVDGTSIGDRALVDAGDGADFSHRINPSAEGVFPIRVSWEAKKLDGGWIVRTNELSVMATSGLDELRHIDLGPSPYVDGRNPVGGEDGGFYGREEALQTINHALAKGLSAGILLVEGNRRIGKSSLLLHYRTRHLDRSRWLCVFIDFQRFSSAERSGGRPLQGLNSAEVFSRIAEEVIREATQQDVTIDIPEIGRFEPASGPAVLDQRHRVRQFIESGDYYQNFLTLVACVLSAISPRQLLLMVDEFDMLQAWIDAGMASQDVPANLRNLFQTFTKTAAIFTGTRKIKRLRQEYWNPLFGMTSPLLLRGLDEPSCRALITEPVAGRISYDGEAITRIIYLTAGQPALVQRMCDRLFAKCEGSHGSRFVTVEMVDEVATSFSADYEEFKADWDLVGSDVQRALAVLLDRLSNEGFVKVQPELLKDYADEQGLFFPSYRDFDECLSGLEELEIVERITERYQTQLSIAVPLLGAWMRQNIDANQLLRSAVNEQQDSQSQKA